MSEETNVVEEVKLTKDNDSTEKDVVVGTPPMVMLPAGQYKYTVDKQYYKINIPKRIKVEPKEGEEVKEEQFLEFSFDNENIFLPLLTRMMFLASRYPDLKENQMFVPVSIAIVEDEVEIVGQLVEEYKD